jgi:hypothetical protein
VSENEATNNELDRKALEAFVVENAGAEHAPPRTCTVDFISTYRI